MKTAGRVSAIGENELIRRLARRLPSGPSVHRGIGDDCAVLEGPAGKWALFASDMLVEGVHFRASADPRQVGWKALAVNVSDVAAMGGQPRYAVVSLGLPPAVPVRWVDALYGGLARCARVFGVDVVGGDTVRSPRRVVDVAIWGEVEKKKIVYRSGARPGDSLLVTGRLGGSLKSGRHLTFMPRLKEARAILSRVRPTAMMDLSDGLFQDLPRLCEASGVSAFVDTSAIPRHPGCSARQAVTDGEDFELLLAVPKKETVRLLEWTHRKGGLRCGLALIGVVNPYRRGEPRILWVDWHNRDVMIRSPGFRHF